MKIALLNGADFKHYSLSMLRAVTARGVAVDLIGNDDMRSADIDANGLVTYRNFYGDQDRRASPVRRLARVVSFYGSLLVYAATTDAAVFHMQSFNKFVFFDRSLLNLYFKLLGKRLVFTAHNIDPKERDGGNTLRNRLSLRILYRLMDHIFVHSQQMKQQLCAEFKVPAARITVIPHGILNTVPVTDLTREEARQRLQLERQERVLLFFGNIVPYKGLEYLYRALVLLRQAGTPCRLVIAGKVKYCDDYWQELERLAAELAIERHLLKHNRFIPDEEVERYFKAADLLVLPYTHIFQSGLPFLACSFGLPLVATDVGALRETVVEGETGTICRSRDAEDLAKGIGRFFASDMYRRAEKTRATIVRYGNETFSWEGIGATIAAVYHQLLPRQGRRQP